MANRIVDVIYRLKDQFTNQVGKITGGYRRMGDEAEKTAKRTERAFTRTGAALRSMVALARRLGAALGVSLGFAAAARSVKQFTSEADRLGKTAQKLGYTAEELQRVGFAAERNGVSFDTMAIALQRMTRRIAEVASTGKGEAAPALEALGLSAKELSQLSLEDRMAKLADAFSAVSDQGERIRLAFKLFDTEGVDMVRVLQEGSAAFKELTQRAGEFGDVISTETTRRAAELSDRVAELNKRWDAFTLTAKSNVVGNLNEALQATGNYLSDEDRIIAGLNDAYATRLDLQQRLSQQGTGALAQRVRRDLEAQLQINADVIRSLQDENVARQQLQQQRLGEQATNQTEIAQRKAVAEAVKGQADAYKVGADSVKEALARETAELRAAKQEQVGIIREFSDLVQDVAGETKDANIIDANYLKLQAQNALNSGDIDGAIEKARAAGEMLRELKQAGEGGFELGYLAKELERIATAASGKKVGQELIDVQAAQQSVDAIKKKLEELKGTKIEIELVPVVSGSGQASDAIRDAVSKRGSK